MDKPIILIDRTIDHATADLLTTQAQVLITDTATVADDLLAQADILCIRTNTTITKAYLARAPHLQLIATATTGTNHIDLDAVKSRGITLITAKGANADSVADYVFRMLFAITDDTQYTNQALKAQPKQFKALKKANNRRELASHTIGIIGLGNIGTRVQARATAFGMHVHAYDPYVSAATATLDEVLRCDIVTIHAELTKETKGMINKAALEQLQDDAIIINAARGELIDEAALATHLYHHPRMHAIIDVFCNEPAPSPLYTLENCTVTPHIAGNAAEAKRRAAQMIAEKIVTHLIKVTPNHTPAAIEAHA